MTDNAAAETNFDLEPDATRLKALMAAAGDLEKRLLTRAGDTYRVGGSATEGFRLRDIDEIYEGAERAAKLDRELFIERYARVLGAVEALDRTRDRIERALTVSQIDDERGARAALRLLDEAGQTVGASLDMLESFATRAEAEATIRTRAAEFDSEVGALQARVREAASEFGVEGDKLEWAKYALQESRAANQWRIGTIACLAGAFVLTLLGITHIIGDSNNWNDVVLKGLAAVSLGGIGGYAGAQSAEHRKESRLAQRTALDLVTLTLFVERLSPESRDLVLRNFGTQRFSQVTTPASSLDDSPILQQPLVQLAAQMLEVAKRRP